MTHYLLIHDAAFFIDRLTPALAACWRQRRFAPGRDLFAELAAPAREAVERYRLGEPPLLTRAADLPFGRDLWRHVAGEALFFGAAEIPELEFPAASLARLTDPTAPPADELPRERYTPIQQALYGSADLTFGGGYYRPDAAGLNDGDVVRRLADYLGAIDPAAWRADDLAGLPGMEDADDRVDEVGYAREWFGPLLGVYRRASLAGQVVVCERLG